jgi:ferredoxin like protein
MDNLFELTLEDKLYRTKYEPDAAHPHIKVNDDACVRCDKKPCLRFCSGGVYKLNPSDKQHVTVSHENCLECGTCRFGCPFDAIDWQYPDGGMGVKYRYG